MYLLLSFLLVVLLTAAFLVADVFRYTVGSTSSLEFFSSEITLILKTKPYLGYDEFIVLKTVKVQKGVPT